MQERLKIFVHLSVIPPLPVARVCGMNQGTGNKCTNLDLSVTYKRVVRGVVHKVTVSVCNSPLCKIKTFQLSTKREL